MAPIDMLHQPLEVDDYVVLYNNVYQIKEFLGKVNSLGGGMARIILVDKSETTKSVKKHTWEMCKIERKTIISWMVKKGYQWKSKM